MLLPVSMKVQTLPRSLLLLIVLHVAMWRGKIERKQRKETPPFVICSSRLGSIVRDQWSFHNLSSRYPIGLHFAASRRGKVTKPMNAPLTRVKEIFFTLGNSFKLFTIQEKIRFYQCNCS